MPPFFATIFGFIRGIPGAALNFIDRRRWWAKEDRAEIEKTYKDERQDLQDELNDAESAEERERIEADIKSVRAELRNFRRATREELLSKAKGVSWVAPSKNSPPAISMSPLDDPPSTVSPGGFENTGG